MRAGTKHGAIVAAFTLGAALASAPRAAHALSCEPYFWRMPDTGAVDVPTNALLWGYFGSYTQLLGPSGERVDVDELELVTLEGVGATTTRPVLAPRSELQPNTEYTIVTDVPSVGERITFRTASGPATAAPPRPTLIASETSTGSSWLGSPSRYQSLDFEAFAEGRLALLGDIADTADGDQSALDALTSVRELLSAPTEPSGPVIEWLSEHNSLSVGVADCSSWPQGAADRQDARFGAFDLAGNFSGWIDVPLALPSSEEARAELDREEAERERERAEAASKNLQKPRSAIASCSMAAPLGARNASSPVWLSLGVGLVIAALRRGSRR